MPTPIISADPNTGQPIVALDISPNVATSALVGDAGVAMAKALIDNVSDVKANYANVLRWGLVGDRVTPNDSQLDDLLAYLKTLVIRPAIYFPAGFYLFNSQVNFDIPYCKVVGDGPNASSIVCDAGVLMNYQEPVITDIAIVPESATSAGTGLELRNVWHFTAERLNIPEFRIGILVSLTDEGDGLIPGNTPGGPYPIPQFGGAARHSSWPWADEMVRTGMTTTEHWGSRVSIGSIENCDIQGRNGSELHTGIYLNNTLADATLDYDTFRNISTNGASQAFFTGIQIQRNHIFCNGQSIWITAGVHAVKINNNYLDMKRHGIRLEYGAAQIEIDQNNFDTGAELFHAWTPITAFTTGDIRRVGDRSYICATGGTSVANINHNGVPNSEFIGTANHVKGRLLASAANSENLESARAIYGMRTSSANVELYFDGITMRDGKRWLDLSLNLPAVSVSSETMLIYFGNFLVNPRWFPVVVGDELHAQFLIRNRDPKGGVQPSLTGVIRAADVNGSQTETSASVDIDALSGFTIGNIVTYNESVTLAVGTSVKASPSISITYAVGQSGSFHFSVAQPQINSGASLGSYVRTYGRTRSRWQDGPQGTGTAIADGTCIWDYDGAPISRVMATRAAWEPTGQDSRGDIAFRGLLSRFEPAPEIGGPLPYYFVVMPNPANADGDPTTIED